MLHPVFTYIIISPIILKCPNFSLCSRLFLNINPPKGSRKKSKTRPRVMTDSKVGKFLKKFSTCMENNSFEPADFDDE